MNMRLSTLIALGISTAAVLARAEGTSDLPPPHPPFVAPVPDAADWTVTVKAAAGAVSPAAGAHLAAHITEVHTTQTGRLRRDDIVYSDGSKTSHWFQDKLLLWKTPEGDVMANDLRAAPVADPEDANPSIPEGFPGVAWLQMPYYDKVVPLGKVHSYHFVHGGTEAWIDGDSLLPVAYKTSGSMYTYKFNDPPSASLQLPPEYQKALDKVKEITRREQLLRRRPVANR